MVHHSGEEYIYVLEGSIRRSSDRIRVTAQLIDTFTGGSDEQSFFSGPHLKWLKYQNILWLALISWAVYWVTRSNCTVGYCVLQCVGG